jgi:Pyruvate/2-oxoglutarate dehydrogenase complex, dihydrolipoamide acyltransferase (E2) component, and related enzymes
MHEVIMPKLGLTMETGTIEKWHKKEGDKVEAGEVLLEVMTDKVSLEIEAYNSGYLLKVLRNQGEEVPVTEVIAYIGQKGEKVVETAKTAMPAQEVSNAPVTAATISQGFSVSADDSKDIKISPLAKNLALSKGVDISKVSGTGPGGRIVKEDIENYAAQADLQPAVSSTGAGDFDERIKISPLAKSLAKELGVDIAQIRGTGPEGRIVKEDILAFSEKNKAAFSAPAASAAQSAQLLKPLEVTQILTPPKAFSSVPLKGIRKIIADRMVFSKQNIPHILLTTVVSVDSLVDLRDKIKDKAAQVYGAKITYTDFIIKACATVLAEQKQVNSSLTAENNHVIYADVNIGVAVAIDSGLIVPTIYDCSNISIFEIARRRASLVNKAKEQKLSMEEISNATFTISNLGMLGVRTFTAIINPPQGAILMVGEIYKDTVVDENDNISVQRLMQISIGVDHRIIDGAVAAKYLQRLKAVMESPELLLI